MKTTVMVGTAVALILMCSGQAKAWNCSDPLAERVVVPSNTTGTQGDGDGQLVTYQGQVYDEAPVINVPAPTVTIIPPPTKPKTVHMPRAHKPHPVCPCYDNDNLPKN